MYRWLAINPLRSIIMSLRGSLVVLSGGQDSTTCLFHAKHDNPGEPLHAITFHYGQRHAREIAAAEAVARMAGVDSHEVLMLPEGILRSTSPLVDLSKDVGHYAKAEDMPGGVEPTFVPMRNALFLTLAANRAAHLRCARIVTGVCEEDFGGYPDCREVFIEAQGDAIGLALPDEYGEMYISTPLMKLSKQASVELAASLPGCMEALAYSHTCYDGQYPPNPLNHASILRARGFEQAGIADPLITRAKVEGLLPIDYPDSGLVMGTIFADICKRTMR
jgi:7-cyano-7-deazaguanine synthase